MKIDQIDKNLATVKSEIGIDNEVLSIPSSKIDLYGVHYDQNLGCFQRMSHSVAKSINYNIEVLSSTTAGARARFETDSAQITLSISYRYLAKMNQMAHSGASGFSLLEETKKGYRFVHLFKPIYSDEHGYTQSVQLGSKKLRKFVLFFPLYNDYINEILLAFDKNSYVGPGNKYDFELPILYYGSSITQGAAASRPDTAYQAYISKWNNVDFLNLGFSGGAKGEDAMIEYLSNIKSLIFVCDYDYNAPDAAHLKNTHYKLYNAYRTKNPSTPIIIMTAPNYSISNKKNYMSRFNVIKNTFDRAIMQGDKNVYFIDGRNFFKMGDRDCCTVDGCHPNDLGFYRMAKSLNKIIKQILSKVEKN